MPVRVELELPPAAEGFLRYRPGVSGMADPHCHDELELNLVTAGSATYLLQGQRYELGRYALVLLFPQQEHLWLRHSRRCDYWIGVFKPALVRRVCTTPTTAILTEGNPPGQFCRILDEERGAQLASLFYHVARSDECAATNAGLAFALLAAWEAFQAQTRAVPASPLHPGIERAARLLRDEVDEPSSFPALAAQVGLSAPYLGALFQQQTGMTMTAYRNRQRLARFVECITHSTLKPSLLDAALQAGFGSYSQFYRVVRELYGCSPEQYLARLKAVPAQDF